MIRLRVGGVPEHFNLPWRLAIEEGAFKNIGMDVHWSDMTGGTGQMIRGLETGSLDLAVLLTEGICRSILKGLPAKIVQIYVSTPLRWGIHVPLDSGKTETNQLENGTFAISREGSGSHLMAYVLGDQHGWKLDSLKFNVVGDVYGGLWAIEHHHADAFLWEKYTTQPFVSQKKCDRIGEIRTPWPCFVIAVREEIAIKYPEQLKNLQNVINQSALSLKTDVDAAEKIGWRYNLDKAEAAEWLSETEWNYSGKSYHTELQGVIQYLEKLNLITTKETENWGSKLFID